MPYKEPPKATQFKKGKSGNPKGRPKLPSIRDALARILADEKDGYTALDATLMALRNKAIRGDVRAAEALLDRAFGKPKQSIDHTSNDQPLMPTRVEWVIVDPAQTK